MPLEEREEELYSRNAPRHPPRPALPSERQRREIPEAGAEWGRVEAMPQPPVIQPEMQRGAKRILRIIMWSGMVLILVGGGAYGFLKWWGRPSVGLAIEGSTEVRAGDRISYEIIVKNSSRNALEKTSLTVRAGSGTLLRGAQDDLRILRPDFPVTLEAGAIRREKIEVYFLGKEDDVREFEISFSYRIPNIASEFVRTEKIKAKIVSPAVNLILNLPKQTLSNNNFEFGYEWVNLSELPIRNITAELSYPADFSFVSATPSPEEGKRWQFEELPARSASSVSVVGRLGATAGQTRTVRASLFTRVRGEQILLGETASDISVIENPLIIAMSVNGETSYNAAPGELLDYRITFKNNFSETLRDIVIVAKLSGRMFDIKTVKSDGAFDSRDLTVTFHGGNSPQLLFLDPQESGSVSFRIRLLESIPEGLRNSTVTASAEMTSRTQPRYVGIEGPVRATASVDVNVSGIMRLLARVLLRDASTGFAVVGPWPMIANQTTQMTVRWNVSAAGNDFNNIVVSTTLPGGVSYIGNAAGNISGTQITANPRTSRVEWQIPKLAAYQLKELIFQIGITPSAADIGNPVKVMNAVRLTATDSFTGNRIEFEIPARRSDELDDPSIQRPDTEGRVLE